MNKLFLITFAVVACVAAASVVTTTDDVTVNLIEQGLHKNELTPEQKKCVDDAVKKAREDSPELAKWLDEVESVKKSLQAKAEKCQKLENEKDKKLCLIHVKIEGKHEWIRLVKQLTPEQKKALAQLKAEIKKCVN